MLRARGGEREIKHQRLEWFEVTMCSQSPVTSRRCEGGCQDSGRGERWRGLLKEPVIITTHRVSGFDFNLAIYLQRSFEYTVSIAGGGNQVCWVYFFSFFITGVQGVWMYFWRNLNFTPITVYPGYCRSMTKQLKQKITNHDSKTLGDVFTIYIQN